MLRRTRRADDGIVLRGATVRYGRRPALEAVSGRFAPGSLTAIVGANGAGKSTLLAAIAGTVRLTAGEVDAPPREQMAYLPQRATIDPDHPLTVSELITLGGWGSFGAFRSPSAAVRAQAETAAAAVGLTERAGRRVGELSAGQLQRALFARLLLRDAPVILLDEPFAAVDAPTLEVLRDLVLRWHAEGRTVIAVLHDLEMVRTWFPSVVVMARRCVGWGATEATLGVGPGMAPGANPAPVTPAHTTSAHITSAPFAATSPP